MNQLQAHLESQGIRCEGITIKPCWGCRDKAAFDWAQEYRKNKDSSYHYHDYWHPWHDGKTEMPEWSWLQRIAFRLKIWSPECLCRACNGAGETECWQMRSEK